MLQREYRHFVVLQIEEVFDEFCGSDVEDELALERDDNPGRTTGTKSSVLHRIIFPFLVTWGC